MSCQKRGFLHENTPTTQDSTTIRRAWWPKMHKSGDNSRREKPMAEFVTLAGISDPLTERYGVQGKAAAERLQLWLLGAIPMTFPDTLAKHLEEQYLPLLFDAFWQVLPFGTGGRRGSGRASFWKISSHGKWRHARRSAKPPARSYGEVRRPTNARRRSLPPTPTRDLCGECRIPIFGKSAGSPICSTFPVQHHPGAHGATPPHLRRGAFKNSPPDSGGVASLMPGWLPARKVQGWPTSKNVETPGGGLRPPSSIRDRRYNFCPSVQRDRLSLHFPCPVRSSMIVCAGFPQEEL